MAEKPISWGRLAPEPCSAPDTEPSLQGLVFLSILPCRPEKQATDKNGGQEEHKTENDHGRGVHQVKTSLGSRLSLLPRSPTN